jgi:predicted nucleic acid-binding protein
VTFVLDASVALSWLLLDADAREAAYAFAILKALRAGGVAASVPATWGLEIANVVARAERKDQLTEAQSESFPELLQATHTGDPTHGPTLIDRKCASLLSS